MEATVERENESGTIRTDEKRVRARSRHDYRSGEEVQRSPEDGARCAGECHPGRQEAARTREPEVGSAEGIDRCNLDGGSESAAEAAAYGASDLHPDWGRNPRPSSGGINGETVRAGEEAGVGAADERRDLRAAVIPVGRRRASGLV